jgi:hypothetical protein
MKKRIQAKTAKNACGVVADENGKPIPGISLTVEDSYQMLDCDWSFLAKAWSIRGEPHEASRRGYVNWLVVVCAAHIEQMFRAVLRSRILSIKSAIVPAENQTSSAGVSIPAPIAISNVLDDLSRSLDGSKFEQMKSVFDQVFQTYGFRQTALLKSRLGEALLLDVEALMRFRNDAAHGAAVVIRWADDHVYPHESLDALAVRLRNYGLTIEDKPGLNGFPWILPFFSDHAIMFYLETAEKFERVLLTECGLSEGELKFVSVPRIRSCINFHLNER